MLLVADPSRAITCPLHSTEEWRRLKRETPELFERACWLEAYLNARRHAVGRDEVWLTRHGCLLARSLLAQNGRTVKAGVATSVVSNVIESPTWASAAHPVPSTRPTSATTGPSSSVPVRLS